MEKLPENCVTEVLSLTSPKDACRLSLVDTTFCRAAASDQVWEKFLPTDYKAMISQAANPPNVDELKTFKQLYFWLCDNPLIIDQGTKSFSLDKPSGKKCYMIAARDLNIIYWRESVTLDLRSGEKRHIIAAVDLKRTQSYTSPFSKLVSAPDSRFGQGAELSGLKVIEFRGKVSIDLLSENTTYTAFLVYKQIGGAQITRKRKLHDNQIDASEECGMSQIFTVRVPRVLNEENKNNTQVQDEIIGRPYTRKREDGWWEIKLRGYYNGASACGKDDDLNMGVRIYLKETIHFIVQGIEIRPKVI